MEYHQYIAEILLETQQDIQIIDITAKVAEIVKKSGIKEGSVKVFSGHTTAGLITQESEKGLLEDLENYYRKSVSEKGPKYFKHDRLELRDCPENEPINGHAHILTARETNHHLEFLISNGKIKLYQWKSILFVETDGPCPRDNKGIRRVDVLVRGERI